MSGLFAVTSLLCVLLIIIIIIIKKNGKTAHEPVQDGGHALTAEYSSLLHVIAGSIPDGVTGIFN
jgi:hypothetical protein